MKFPIALLVASIVLTAYPQSASTAMKRAAAAQSKIQKAANRQKNKETSSPNQSFEEFRAGITQDFNNFKGRIFDHYADFLAGEWHPFESQFVDKKYEEPKPQTPPAIPENETPPITPSEPIVEFPKPKPEIKPQPKPEVKPQPKPEVKPQPKPEIKPQPKPQPKPEVKPQSTPSPKVKPQTAQKPSEPETNPNPQPSANATKPGWSFDFYGMNIGMTKPKFQLLNSIGNPSAELPKQWKQLEKSPEMAAAVQEIKKESTAMGLNPYLTFRFVESYLKGAFPQASDFSRFSVAHYIMSALGNDVRLGHTKNNIPIMLMPFNQIVYGSFQLAFDGIPYTAFLPEGMQPNASLGAIYTPSLPSSGDHGKKSDLKINGLNLPYSPYHYNISSGKMKIEGDVNKNLFKLLYRYPQMPTEDFASSTLSADVRRKIVEQVKSQLSGMSEVDQVNTLMNFFHNGFKYATDQERHGFEKPYFLEENLFYDRNDCEDRAIFFTYLLWNALGKENMLIAYPNHESAAVKLDSYSKGTYYTKDGSKFFSADPTYIGSTVGMCAPSYNGINPAIDKTYKK